MSVREPTASGHVRLRRLRGGPHWYAQVRTADGRRLLKALGPAWEKRSRAPSGYLTRSEAEGRLTSFLEEHGVVAADSGRETVTFVEAAREWLRYVEHDRQRERSTVAGYRHAVEHRLLGAFGDSALDEIDRATAEGWRIGLVRAGLSPSTVNQHRWYCSAIYGRAIRLGWATDDPFEHLERQPNRPSGDFTILRPDEVAALASAAEERDGVMFTVAAFTGLRLGELRALRWSDLDFDARLVHVRRSFVSGAFKVPKSGRVRSVPMIDQVIGPLDRLSRRERFTGPDDLVFASVTGDVIDDSALRRRMARALQAADLHHVRFHDLRHSFCSMAVGAWRIDEVRAYAGHADIAMTMKYVHHVPAHDAASRLSAVVAASVTPAVTPNSALAA